MAQNLSERISSSFREPYLGTYQIEVSSVCHDDFMIEVGTPGYRDWRFQSIDGKDGSATIQLKINKTNDLIGVIERVIEAIESAGFLKG